MKPAASRVIERCVEVTLPGMATPCLVFTGALSYNGYGQVGVGSRTSGNRAKRRAHRVVYEAMVGPIPEGWQIDHLCRNRACCNVGHLEAVTQQENRRRQSAAA